MQGPNLLVAWIMDIFLFIYFCIDFWAMAVAVAVCIVQLVFLFTDRYCHVQPLPRGVVLELASGQAFLARLCSCCLHSFL